VDTREVLQNLTLLLLLFILSLGTDLVRQVWFNYILVDFNETGESYFSYVFTWSSFGFCLLGAMFKVLCGMGADRLNRKKMIIRTPVILICALLAYAIPTAAETKHYQMATLGMFALKVAQAVFDICSISVLYDLFHDFVEP
jgi:MFS family permease